MPVHEPPITTVEQLRALPDDEYARHELLEGNHTVSPPPRLAHQVVLTRLLVSLQNALEARPDLVLVAAGEFVPKSDTLLVPDLFVFTQDPKQPATTWAEAGVPILAVEILSPGTAARDRGIKRRIYQEAGVREYWIVDVDARIIERWRPEDERPEIIDVVLEWQPASEVTVRLPFDHLFTGGSAPA